MNTYGRFPLALVRGQGTRVWDADGIQYIDFLAGIAVNCLGHCHPAVTEAIQKQAETLLHVSNLYHILPQAKLAKLLTELTFADRVFFGNSGAEANEGAIKLARKYHADRDDAKRTTIVSATMSFHGRTLATLTATGQQKVKIGFDPLPEGFELVEYDNIAALEAVVDDTTAAVLLEPIQGEGGVRVPTDGYLKKVRELCDERGALLIFDEVQTGAGRTGYFLACERDGVAPDVATMAKGLGGGVAIGACLATDTVAASFGPGTHASTFGGNPLCTAAALATVETLVEEGLIERTKTIGSYFADKLGALAAKFDVIKEVRGRGLLIGLVLADGLDPLAVVNKLMERGFLTGTAGVGVLRFAPPLTVEQTEIDALVAALEEILKE